MLGLVCLRAGLLESLLDSWVRVEFHKYRIGARDNWGEREGMVGIHELVDHVN